MKALITLLFLAGCLPANRRTEPASQHSEPSRTEPSRTEPSRTESHFVCDQVQQGLCYVTTDADGQRRCERTAGAVWSENGVCPTGIVAECQSDTETRYFYGDYPFDVAEASCTSPLIPPSH